ncbi:unannotated protein [freshwater metagenome]|uniref:Unannotated protein n=1 Tax=freshwater metagenome TaxID=449393 RepID=A0A6J6ME72_9ZZZZ
MATLNNWPPQVGNVEIVITDIEIKIDMKTKMEI